jgi:hypothetical protein
MIKLDIINKLQDISEFSTASGKFFSPKIKIKYFPENQAKFFFD